MSNLLILMASLLLSVGAVTAGVEQQRVAVSVSGADAEQWQSVLTAELGKSAELQLVERAEYGRVLREREELALRGGGDGQRQLAPVAGIAWYLHFREMSHGRWLAELVNAADGQLVGSSEVAAVSVSDAGRLSAAAQKLLANVAAKKSAARATRVAVVEPTGKAANDQVFILAARLRDALNGSGFTVLDRALTQELVIERNEAERGLRDAAPAAALLGADYLLQLAPADGQRCELRLVNAADGRLVAAQMFTDSGVAVVNQIQPWLLPLLGTPERNVQPYLPSVSVEALQPFYRGLKLYDGEKFAEATNEFTRAYMLDRQFKEAYEWEARCYDALTLTPLGDAMRRYARVMLDFSVSTNDDAPAVSDAVMFLGVSGDAPELCAKLSALAADALAASGQKISLPENLAQVCREYDWLAGIAAADGQRWERSPSFFNRAAVSGRLSVSGGGAAIRWVLRDTLSGTLIMGGEHPLDMKPEKWREQIQEFLPHWLLTAEPLAKELAPAAPSPSAAAKISVAELENNLRKAHGMEINLALIKLALAAPDSPLLASYSFEKNDSKRGGVDGFLNHALRDYCIAKLPKGDRQRRWLELTQIYTHIGDNPVGKIYSGQKLNFVELLKKFAADGDKDAPGLVARYSLLFNTQSGMPFGELAAKCEELLADLRAADRRQFSDFDKVAKYTESMRRIARIADGDTSLDFWIDTGSGENWQPSPHCVRLSWHKDQRAPSLDSFTVWVTNDMQFCPLTPEEKIREARVALLFNGRGDFTEIARDEWLEQFPHSLTLTVLAADAALHEINYSLGLPIQHRFNGSAEVASYARQIRYAADGVKFWLGRMDSAARLDRFENVIYRLVTALNERALLEVFSDEQYAALQKELADAVAEADRRTGRNGWGWRRPQRVPWQTLTREQARRQSDNQLFNFQREILDRDFFLQQISRAEADAVAERGRFNPKPWWNVLRGDDIYRVFTQPEFAGFYRRLHSQTLAMFDGDLSSKELGGVFEQALALLRGGDRREAEELFIKIQNSAVTDLNRGYGNTLVKANAAFRLAQICRMDNRLPEAVQQAQLGLQLCGGGSFQVISRRYEDQWDRDSAEHGVSGDLARQLARLLRDLRFDPQRADLPERVRVVTVSTPNMDNPALRIFYREPAAADAQRPSRALVLGAGSNAEIISYLRPDSPWARFADAHHLTLVMPQFRTSYWAWEKTDAYSYYSAAQVWSGQALLDGLKKINEQCAVQQERLLFYAYGSNTGFALRFTRWRPDLVAAVAVGRPSNFGTPRFAEPDLRPMSALKNVAFHIGASEFDDDYCYAFFNRYETAVHFATLLQAADVQVEWKNYPELTPPPALVLEQDAREFLEKQL